MVYIKNLCMYTFLLTTFGSINYGPPYNTIIFAARTICCLVAAKQSGRRASITVVPCLSWAGKSYVRACCFRALNVRTRTIFFSNKIMKYVSCEFDWSTIVVTHENITSSTGRMRPHDTHRRRRTARSSSPPRSRSIQAEEHRCIASDIAGSTPGAMPPT